MDRESFAEGMRKRLQASDSLQDHQRPPPTDDWRGWALIAGRGAGKTYAGMSWLNTQCKNNPNTRARVIAPTFGDGVASCVDGPNGLLTLSEHSAKWNPSSPGGACVTYPNGSRVWIVGTPTPREVDRLRALTNIHYDVFEEAFANPMLNDAWKQANLSRRAGKNPRVVVTSTPRPHPLIKTWEKDETFVISRAISRDNAYVDEGWLTELEQNYQGTRLYRQEVLGEVIEDVEGALWSLNDLERSRYPSEHRSTLVESLPKVVVGVDPPSGQGTCGIIVCGRGDDGHLYVLDDYSVTEATPYQWANRVSTASSDYGALVIAEKNQGGEMVSAVLRQHAPNLMLTTVTASKGKKTRAEPVALRWEAEYQTAHLAPKHPGHLDELVIELTETAWDQEGKLIGESPDRLDAMVWAGTYLRSGRTAEMHAPAAPTEVGSKPPSAFQAVLRGGLPDRSKRRWT